MNAKRKYVRKKLNWKNWEKFIFHDQDERRLFERAINKVRRDTGHISNSRFCREHVLAACRQIIARNGAGNK